MNDCHMYMVQNDIVIGFVEGNFSYSLQKDNGLYSCNKNINPKVEVYINKCDRIYIMNEYSDIWDMFSSSNLLFNIVIDHSTENISVMLMDCYLISPSNITIGKKLCIIDYPQIGVGSGIITNYKRDSIEN